MRTSSAIETLFPAVRRGILASLLLHPNRVWTLPELVNRLGVSPSDLRHELRVLTEGGILHRMLEGRRICYQAHPACPFLSKLRALLLTKADLVEILQEELQPLRSRIIAAFLFGSVVRSHEPATSSIDLFVIGEFESEDLGPPLRAVQARIGRPVTPTIFTPDCFARDLREGDPSLKAVLTEEKLFVIGGPDDLDRLSRTTEIEQTPTRQQSINARLHGTAFATCTVGFAALSASAWFYPQSVDQAPKPPSTPPVHIQSGIDPNTAAWYELAQLPGIGETCARTIVDHRNLQREQGGNPAFVVYRKPDDLSVIRGIGDRTVRRLAPFLRFPPPAYRQ